LVFSISNRSGYLQESDIGHSENGKWTFSWGSWWQGIYGTSNVNPTTGKLTSTSGYVNLANRGGSGIEASTIYKSGCVSTAFELACLPRLTDNATHQIVLLPLLILGRMLCRNKQHV